MEYVTARLIAEVIGEIKQGQLAPDRAWSGTGSMQGICAADPTAPPCGPLLGGPAQHCTLERTALEEQMLALLCDLRARADDAQGYGPANLLALLRELRGHLRGLDLSHLVLRGAYLQGVEMQDTTLAGASLRETVLTRPLIPSGPWRSAAMDSTGLRAAGEGKYGCGAKRGSPAPDLASAHRHCTRSRLQPRWTHAGHRELGW